MSLFKDAGKNRRYTDFYELYKKKRSNTAFELTEIEPEGTFRGCDVVDYYETEEQLNGVSSGVRRYLTIETPARLDFSPGDRLKSLKDDVIWIIRKATVKDDNRAKDKSMRPIKVTVLELWG